MTPLCIHGFRAEQCASCRPCPHGVLTSACGRCRSALATASRRRFVAPAIPAVSSTTYNGFEILFQPALNGWQYRSPEATVSRESYRSEFLARKAIDRLGTPPAKAPARKRSS